MIVSNISSDKIHRGEDKILRISVYENDAITPKDVEGWVLSYVWRTTVKASSYIFRKTTSDDITITGTFNVDPTQNTQKVEIQLFDIDTDDLEARQYYHELKRMDEGGEILLLKGSVELTESAAEHRE